MKKIIKKSDIRLVVQSILKQQLGRHDMKSGYQTTQKAIRQTLQQSLSSTVQKTLMKYYSTTDAMNMVNKPIFEKLIEQCVNGIMEQII